MATYQLVISTVSDQLFIVLMSQFRKAINRKLDRHLLTQLDKWLMVSPAQLNPIRKCINQQYQPQYVIITDDTIVIAMVHCGEGDCTNSYKKKEFVSKWPDRNFVRFFRVPNAEKKINLFSQWRLRLRRRPEDVDEIYRPKAGTRDF